MLIAATAVTASMLSAGSAEAVAACTIKSYTPSKFIVGATATTKAFGVKTSTGCVANSWAINFGGGLILSPSEGNRLIIDPVHHSDEEPGLTNADAGAYAVKVSAKSRTAGVGRVSKNMKFFVQRRSTFGTTLNVGAEPAETGDTLKVVGTLKRISWDTSTYGAYAGRTVQVQFKASGTSTYKTIKNATTDANGKVATTVKAVKSGTWRLSYAGNTTTGAAISNVDGVKVS